MKSIKLVLGLCALICALQACQQAPPATAAVTEAPAKVSQKGLLKHMVIFKFKDSSSVASVDSCVAAFRGLEGKVPQIQALDFGLNKSPENWHQGFTHCFELTFKNYEDLAIYAEHPEHKAFQKILGPHMEKVFVVDYVVE